MPKTEIKELSKFVSERVNQNGELHLDSQRTQDLINILISYENQLKDYETMIESYQEIIVDLGQKIK